MSLYPASSPANVAVLMCTYNGQSFIQEQLDSIAAQTHSHWQVWASDDGSTDGTLALLARQQSQWPQGKLHVLAGPQRGFACNFLSMACNRDIDADFFAFSDQDDVWERDKLARALEWIQTVPPDVPALYCSRTRLVDDAGKEIGFSPLFEKPPGFANALLQSIAGGNTMVFNKAARALLQIAGPGVGVVTHDWWAYIVVTACGGQVHYDPQACLSYRQHQGNLVGSNATFAARFKRVRQLWQGQLRRWNDAHLAALACVQPHIPPHNLALLHRFAQARQRPLWPRLWGLARCGLYRQTFFDDIGLVFASIFKKL